MKPLGTLMSLNPRSTRDTGGWHITVAKSSGTEVGHEAALGATEQAPRVPILLSLCPVVFDGQQLCPT